MDDPYVYAGTFKQGIYFLARYLADAMYYEVHHDGRNLDPLPDAVQIDLID